MISGMNLGEPTTLSKEPFEKSILAHFAEFCVYVFMRTTLDLPDPLMRRVKIKAAAEGKKLKEIMAELIEAGLDKDQPQTTLPEGESPWYIDPKTGFPVAKTLKIPGYKPPTLQETQELIEKSLYEEDLHRAGLLP